MSYYAKVIQHSSYDNEAYELYIQQSGLGSSSLAKDQRAIFATATEAHAAAQRWIDKYQTKRASSWSTGAEVTQNYYVAIVGYRNNTSAQEYFLTPYSYSMDIDKAMRVQPSDFEEIERRVRELFSFELRRIVPESVAKLGGYNTPSEAEDRLDRNPETKARLEKALEERDQSVLVDLEVADRKPDPRVVSGHGWILKELEQILATIDEARSQLLNPGEYDQIRAVVDTAVDGADRVFRQVTYPEAVTHKAARDEFEQAAGRLTPAARQTLENR